MAYLSSFEHDIFISYARVDDQIDPDEAAGWVTRFHEYLERRLSQRFGRRGVVSLWRDTREMGGSTFFDEAIQRAINGSAIFLALNSPGYLAKEGYCLKELDWFYRKAKDESYGLKINSQSRIFNVLLQNIPHTEYPPEMAGTTGLAFHDAERPDAPGWPSTHDSDLFSQQLRQLVYELEVMLRAFKNEVEVSERQRQQQQQQATAYGDFTVFLAHTEGTLNINSRRIGDELRQKGLNVVTRLPPPHPFAEHNQKVIEEVGRADLAVHLLDEAPGMEVIDAPGKFYYREQVALARQHAKSQIICVSKLPEGQEIEDAQHRQFIDDLDTEGRGQNSYTFIRDTPGSFQREILAQIEKIVAARHIPAPGPAALSTALLDTHPKDMRYVLDLSPVLDERSMDFNIISGKGDPQKGMSLFEESLKTVSVLIIIFGQVTADWVRERLNCALQIVTSGKCPLRLCCIYAPPDESGGARQFPPGAVPGAVPTFRIDRPEILGTLLDSYLL